MGAPNVMRVDMTEDQSLFRNTSRRFIETQLPLGRTRELHGDPVGFTQSWLRSIAELGWFAMLAPVELGGGNISGEGLLDLAIVMEECGRHVQPGPIVPMNVVVDTISRQRPSDHEEAIASIVSGRSVATWAFDPPSTPLDRAPHVTATRCGDTYRVDGTHRFVQDACSADLLLVSVSLEDRAAQLLVPTEHPGVTRRPLETLDLARRIADVDFDAVEVPASNLIATGPDVIERQLQLAASLNCVETVGAMDALFQMTVEYSKDRIAFGRPIGSFQALKHVMADMALYLETSKALADAATEAVARNDPDAPAIVSMAAAYIAEHSNELAQECLQIHGGIGFTWEHDLHLYLRRIRSNSVLYGSADWHRERVCAHYCLGEGDVA
jgi:alkylation response protein AidB-like acyl-CoA dehydrogenase